jgi:uncharacterized membrane protein (UPF0182 family)
MLMRARAPHRRPHPAWRERRPEGCERSAAPQDHDPIRVVRTRKRAVGVLATFAVLFVVLRTVARLETERLWFREVGQEDVFWTVVAGPQLAGFVAGLGTTVLLLGAARFAERTSVPPERWPYGRWPHVVLQAAQLAASVAAGLVVGHSVVETHWQQLVLWVHRRDFGVTDPLFHEDVGFFVFSLPLLRAVAAWLLLMTVISLAGALATYAASGAIRVRPVRVTASPTMRMHVLGLTATLLVLLAWRHRLDQFGLALPRPGETVPGAGYTSVHAELPWMRAMTVIDLAAAVAVGISAVLRRSWMLPAFTIAVVVVLEAFSPSVIPDLVQRFIVEPQTLSRERPYLAFAIDATRRAYDLDRVTERSLPANARISPQELAANADVLRNIQLWDPDVLRPEINQQQAVDSYYDFAPITADRYVSNGEPQAMLVAQRELDLRRLDPSGRTWANDHLAYTHGHGLIAVPAGDAGVDDQGRPRFVTPQSGGEAAPTRLRQPRIYFGVQPPGAQRWVVANTHRSEVEEPVSGASPTKVYHYTGAGGIPMTGTVRRAVLALSFDDLNLLLSHTLGAAPRLLLHRSVSDRLKTLAPFLHWDRDTQTAVVDGRIVFLSHGYTSTDAYPYSAQVRVDGRRLNYMRAAVLATVDAFSGSTKLYVTDPGDPLIATWQGVFPTLLQPASAIPAGVRAQLRYPRGLFDVQTWIWGTYHREDVDSVYTRVDTWKRPTDVSGPIQDFGNLPDMPRLAPEYMLARLPGDAEQRFLLTTPYTPYSRENMTGYLAGAVDDDGRPSLTQLNLSATHRVPGPEQVARQILADPAISNRLFLLNTETTDLGDRSVNIAEIGRPQVVPIGDAFLHVQTIYVTNRSSGVTRLRLVAAYLNGRIGYGHTLAAAIQSALGPAPADVNEADAG